MTFYEKPLFCESFHHLVWRAVGSGPACVKSHGKMRSKEDVHTPISITVGTFSRPM